MGGDDYRPDLTISRRTPTPSIIPCPSWAIVGIIGASTPIPIIVFKSVYLKQHREFGIDPNVL